MQTCRAASQLEGPSKTLKHLDPETVQPEGQVEEATHWKGLAVPQVTGAQEKREKRPQERVHLAEPREERIVPSYLHHNI